MDVAQLKTSGTVAAAIDLAILGQSAPLRFESTVANRFATDYPS